jgi:hypothetical protein
MCLQLATVKMRDARPHVWEVRPSTQTNPVLSRVANLVAAAKGGKLSSPIRIHLILLAIKRAGYTARELICTEELLPTYQVRLRAKSLSRIPRSVSILKSRSCFAPRLSSTRNTVPRARARPALAYASTSRYDAMAANT